MTASNSTEVESNQLQLITINIDLASQLARQLDEFYRRVLKPGVDYVVLPGTTKPCLKKEGAELLTIGFDFEVHTQVVSTKVITEPDNVYFEYEVQCTLSRNGVKVKDAYAAANSREKQFAFKWVDADAVNKDIKTYGERTHEGRRQVRVMLEPWEVYSLQNQVLKMADKRAFVAAVLRATGASRIFTQDLEEEDVSSASAGSANATSQQQPQQRQQQTQTQVDLATEKQVNFAYEVAKNKLDGMDIVSKFLEEHKKSTIRELTKLEASDLIHLLTEGS